LGSKVAGNRRDGDTYTRICVVCARYFSYFCTNDAIDFVINSVDTLHFQLGACGIRGASAVSKNKPMSKHQNAPLAPRQEELLQLLAANGQISVDELARHFSVSDDTIRRDFHELDGAGCCSARTVG
jgi:hypothetical protein